MPRSSSGQDTARPPARIGPLGRATRTTRSRATLRGRSLERCDDGTSFTIRPITPDDRDELRREFQRISPQTRYLRFLGVVGELSDEMLTYLTCVDQQTHIALVAIDRVAGPQDRARRRRRAPHPPEGTSRRRGGGHHGRRRPAEARDRHARSRIELERAARARGIRHIRADVLEGNAAMRGILESAGAQRVDAGETPGTISYDIALDPALRPASSWLIDVLRGAAQTMAVSIRKLVPPDRSDLVDLALRDGGAGPRRRGRARRGRCRARRSRRRFPEPIAQPDVVVVVALFAGGAGARQICASPTTVHVWPSGQSVGRAVLRRTSARSAPTGRRGRCSSGTPRRRRTRCPASRAAGRGRLRTRARRRPSRGRPR